jgi:hypothetical protein
VLAPGSGKNRAAMQRIGKYGIFSAGTLKISIDIKILCIFSGSYCDRQSVGGGHHGEIRKSESF